MTWNRNVRRGLGSPRDYMRIAPDAHLGFVRTPDCSNADPPQPDKCTVDGGTSYPLLSSHSGGSIQFVNRLIK